MKALNWSWNIVMGIITLTGAGVAIVLAGFIIFSWVLGDRGAIPALAKEVPEYAEKIAAKLAGKLSEKDGLKPIVSAKAPEVVTPKATVHTVKRGEWLSKIAAKYETTVEQIVDANKETYPSLRKNPNLIHKGWSLTIRVETHSSPENSVAKAKQSVYPEKTAKAASRDKHNASKKTDTPKPRVASKKHRNASRSTEKFPKIVAARINHIVSSYGDIVEAASSACNAPKHVVYGVIYHESGGNPKALGDGGKSRGLMQLHDPTRIKLGLTKKEAHDPEKAIPAGTKYFCEQLQAFDGNVIAAVSGYNAPLITQKMLASNQDPGKRSYVRAVMAAAKLFKKHEKSPAS